MRKKCELKFNFLLQKSLNLCIIGGDKVPDKLLDLKNDLVFQELFGKQKNCQITSHLLSLILKRDIFNIDLDANKRMLGNRQNSKTGRLDIRVKFNNGEDCNIELQVAPYHFMPERMLDYWSVMYNTKINSGQQYDSLKPSISILIADYNLNQLKNIEKYHTVWNLREKDFSNLIISNNIELHILEIPKIKNNELLKDELAQWLKFIENPENEEVNCFMSENKFFKQAREELAYLSGDPDFQRLVESRAGFLMDQDVEKRANFEDGKAVGLSEGIIQNKKEIAKKMKKENMPIDQIIKLTDLSKEEIEKL